MKTTLDFRLENLGLSTRTQNVLRRLGCTTLASIVQGDYRHGLRGLGRATREEVAELLDAHGFEPPDGLLPSESSNDKILAEMLERCDEMEADLRRSITRIERLEGADSEARSPPPAPPGHHADRCRSRQPGECAYTACEVRRLERRGQKLSAIADSLPPCRSAKHLPSILKMK